MNNEIHISGPSQDRKVLRVFLNLLAIIVFVLPFYIIHNQITGPFVIKNENRVNRTDPRWIRIKKGSLDKNRVQMWYKAKPDYHFYISFGIFICCWISFGLYKLGLLGFNILYLKIEGGMAYKEVKRFDNVVKKNLIGKLSYYNHIYFGKGVISIVLNGGGGSHTEVFVVELRGENHLDNVHKFPEFLEAKNFAEKVSEKTSLPLRNDFEKSS